MSSWWTDEKVNSVVRSEYITGKLGGKSHFRLHASLAFGHGLTDDTYLDWILSRGRRLFLILDDIGCPDTIFDAVDKSLDDDDLPLTQGAVVDLNLSHGKHAGFDKRFYRRQFYYLIQELGPGKHVDYGPEDVIPVNPIGKAKTSVTTSADVDQVYVGNHVFTRRRMDLGGEYGVDKIHFVMYYKNLQKLKHPHLLSVWATYTQGTYAYVLLGPNSDVSLTSFLEDPPKTFKALTKQQKRDILLRWVHCLTDAVAYLHKNGFAHQAIRPSNIFIDSNHNIFLGEYAAMDALEEEEPAYKRETYEHAPPEKWIRKTVLQDTAPLRSTLHGGGRTNHRIKNTTTKAQIPLNGVSRRNSGNSTSAGGLFRRAASTPSTNSSPAISRNGSFAPNTTTFSTVSTAVNPMPDPPNPPSRQHSYAPTYITTTSHASSAPAGPTSPLYGPHSSHSGPTGPLPPLPRQQSYTPSYATMSTHASSAPSGPASRKNSLAPTTSSATSSSSTTSTVGKQKRTLVTTFTQDTTPTPYPSDIFSLSTIHVLLLSGLFALSSSSLTSSKYSPSSLRAHLGKMNRTAGRGGAPSDCSFHVNLGQVDSWLDRLEREAAKRGDGHFFAAASLVTLARKGLLEKWENRWEAGDGERSIRHILEQWVPGGWGTCCGVEAHDNEKSARFRLGLTGDGDVEIGSRKSAGTRAESWMPSPPWTETGSGSNSGSASSSAGQGRGRRPSFEESVAASVIYLDGVSVEEEDEGYAEGPKGEIQHEMRIPADQVAAREWPVAEKRDDKDDMRNEMETLKRELEALRREVVKKDMPVKKPPVVRPGRRGGGMGKVTVVAKERAGDDLVRSFFRNRN